MTTFEYTYLLLDPFLLPLHRKVRKKLKQLTVDTKGRLKILDVGGRKSHYTIGIPAEITISDVPRNTEVQKKLHLGINDAIINTNLRRRSNLKRVVYDDMTNSQMESSSFDCVVAVEVLEHVEQDTLFLREVYRVLKPEGIFLMTTPNGDFVKNTNPDHKRHYKKDELMEKLNMTFDSAEVFYDIRGGITRRLGLRSLSIRHPIQTLVTMGANFINYVQSRGTVLSQSNCGTHHLIAVARKSHAN